MIKLVCLTSQRDLLENVIGNNNLGFDVKTITDIFFVNVRDYQRIIDVMKTKRTHLSDTINRDTSIIDMLFKKGEADEAKGEQVIFVYTLLKYLVEDFGEYITNDELVADMIRLLNTLVGGGKSGRNIFNNIVAIYENLRKNNVSLEKNHQLLVNRMSNSFVYIKYRQDTPVTNPRYKVKKIQQGPSSCYLNVRYKNIDGTFGYDSTGVYSHENALKTLNSNLLTNHERVHLDGGVDRMHRGLPSSSKKRFNENPSPAPVDVTPATNKIEEVKVVSEDKLDDLQIPEFYYFGSFNGIYSHEDKNDYIVNDIQNQPNNIIKKLLNGEDLCLVGYGQSGAGKTSTLIFKKGKTGDITDGIIIEMLKLKEVIDTFESITLKATDLYTFHWQDNTDYTNYDPDNYRTKPIIIDGVEEVKIKYDPKSKNWLSGTKVIGQIIDEIFTLREIEPTPNNPESSRSHLICCLTLHYKKGTEKKDPRKIIICDLAGVENVFKCDDLAEMLKFDQRYGKDNKKYNGKISFDSYFKNQGESTTVKNKPDNVLAQLRDYDVENDKIEMYKSLDGGDSDTSSSLSSSSSSSVSSYSSSELDDETSSSSDDDSTDSDSTDFDSTDTDSTDSSDSDSDSDNESDLEEFYHLLDGQVSDKDKNDFIEECKTTRLSNILATSKDDLKQQIDDEYNKIVNDFKYNQKIVTVLQDFIPMFKDKSYTGDRDRNYGVTLPDKYKNFVPDNSLFRVYKDTALTKEGVMTTELQIKKVDAFIRNTDKIDANMFVAVLYKVVSKDFTSFIESKGEILYMTRDSTLDSEIRRAEKELTAKLTANENMKKNLIKQLCLKHRYEAISYNCRLRVIEGTMINHSLSEFRRDLKNIMLHSLKVKNRGILPLMFEENISTYCRNLYMMSDYYDTFDIPLQGSVKELELGAIFKIISNDVKDLSKLNFGIFTVINLSDTTNDVMTNNPPTPPYVNLSRLIYQIPVQFGGMSFFKDNKSGNQREDKNQKQTIIKTLDEILSDTLAKYEFYKSNPDLLQLKASIPAVEVDKDDYKQIHQKFIQPFIKIINSNNPSSLIGSLQGTQELVRPASGMIIPSFNKYLYDKQPILFRRGDAKIEIVYGSNGSSNTITDEAFDKTLKFRGHDLF